MAQRKVAATCSALRLEPKASTRFTVILENIGGELERRPSEALDDEGIDTQIHLILERMTLQIGDTIRIVEGDEPRRVRRTRGSPR
jgi:hypothetical protein